MALAEESLDVQNPLVLDALLCEEGSIEEEGFTEDYDSTVRNTSSLPLILFDNDLFWEDDELVSLISKEGGTHFCFTNLITDGPLKEAREEAVLWVSKVCARYNFSALTTVLAVNYFDRFIASLKFQKDKPWMTQLAAVACLSLAAKMEETQVPLLLDLQVEESKYVFEAKTIQRMELLVLSALEWRMNPVTPISFFEHIVRRLGLKSHLHWEFLWRCERLLLLVIVDSKVTSYLPSTIAAATIIHVIGEIEPFNAMEYRTQLLGLLKISEEQVNQCYKLILKILCCREEDIQNLKRKRRRPSEPGSPDDVIDASFSCDSSNDSWAVGSVAVSPEPTVKRSRCNTVAINILNASR